jgi:hypothetical protein
MKMGEEIIVIIMAATIGLGLFVGIASATGKTPFAEILDILMGVNTKLDNIEQKVDNSATQMLGTYGERWDIMEPESATIWSIETDKPVVFIISMKVFSLDAGEIVEFRLGGQSADYTIGHFEPIAGVFVQEEFCTVTGHLIWINVDTVDEDDTVVCMDVMVQGTLDTQVTVYG